MKNIKPECIGITLSKENYETITGYSEQEIVSMTGANTPLIDENNYVILDIYGEYPTLKINIQTPFFSMVREINFMTKNIRNFIFTVDKKFQGVGIASKVFYHQVLSAQKEGFQKIQLTAAGSSFNKDEYNGYYTWGRLGFSMKEADNDDMIDLLKSYGHEYIDNMQSLMSDKELRYNWRDNWGFTWEGYFILDVDSDNVKHLNEYIKQWDKN